MGSIQSTKRQRGQFLTTSSSDYTRLPPSLQKPLLKSDHLNGCNCSEQYEYTINDILQKNFINEKKVIELERKIERLDHLLVSKNAEVDEYIQRNASTLRKVTELDQKIQCVENLALSKNETIEVSIKENTASMKKIKEFKQKIERLELLMHSKNATEDVRIKENVANKKKVTELEQMIKHLEHLQLKKDDATEGSIRELQAKADGLTVMSSHAMDEVEFEKAEPEYVKEITGLLLMLIFVVFISIGMQL